ARPHDPEPCPPVRIVVRQAACRLRIGKPGRVAFIPGAGARSRMARRAGSATRGGQIPEKRSPWIGNGGPDTEPRLARRALRIARRVTAVTAGAMPLHPCPATLPAIHRGTGHMDERERPPYLGDLPRDRRGNWPMYLLAVGLLAALIGAWKVYTGTVVAWHERFQAPKPTATTPAPPSPAELERRRAARQEALVAEAARQIM